MRTPREEERRLVLKTAMEIIDACYNKEGTAYESVLRITAPLLAGLVTGLLYDPDRDADLFDEVRHWVGPGITK